jgi:hypothetical protein
MQSNSFPASVTVQRYISLHVISLSYLILSFLFISYLLQSLAGLVSEKTSLFLFDIMSFYLFSLWLFYLLYIRRREYLYPQ